VLEAKGWCMLLAAHFAFPGQKSDKGMQRDPVWIMTSRTPVSMEALASYQRGPINHKTG
jgi:hypothetical protein